MAAKTPQAEDTGAFDVRIASTGQTVHVRAGVSVVEAVAAIGIDIPVSCGEGICGTCLTRVLEGVPDHQDFVLSPEEQEKGDQFTPCCSRAKTPLLVLDL